MEEDDYNSPAEEDNAPDEKRRRLSAAEWVAIVDAYEIGTKGITELASDYGVTRQTISRYFKDNNIQRGSRAQAASQAQAAAAAKAAERYAEKRLEWIEETRLQAYNNLKQAASLLNKRIVDVYKTPGATAESALQDIKALKLYQQALIENFQFRLDGVLRQDDIMDTDDLPDLEISDLTEDDLQQHYESMGMADDTPDNIDDIVASIEQATGGAK